MNSETAADNDDSGIDTTGNTDPSMMKLPNGKPIEHALLDMYGEYGFKRIHDSYLHDALQVDGDARYAWCFNGKTTVIMHTTHVTKLIDVPTTPNADTDDELCDAPYIGHVPAANTDDNGSHYEFNTEQTSSDYDAAYFDDDVCRNAAQLLNIQYNAFRSTARVAEAYMPPIDDTRDVLVVPHDTEPWTVIVLPLLIRDTNE